MLKSNVNDSFANLYGTIGRIPYAEEYQFFDARFTNRESFFKKTLFLSFSLMKLLTN